MNWKARPFWIIVGVLICAFALGWIWLGNPPKPKQLVPVTLTFRKSVDDAGQVAKLKNESGAVFPVTITVTREGVPPLIRGFDINPNVTVEVGPREGWTFKTGDVVELSSAGYETTKTTLP